MLEQSDVRVMLSHRAKRCFLCFLRESCLKRLKCVKYLIWFQFIEEEENVYTSYPETDMTARSWCAARAMEHPLARVCCIWARRDGQSAEISPTQITCSRYSATSVLNSWTVLEKSNHLWLSLLYIHPWLIIEKKTAEHCLSHLRHCCTCT